MKYFFSSNAIFCRNLISIYFDLSGFELRKEEKRVHNSRDGRRGRKGSALDLGQQDQEAGRGPTGRDVINDVGAGQLHHRDQDDPRTVAHQLPVSSSQVDQRSIL